MYIHSIRSKERTARGEWKLFPGGNGRTRANEETHCSLSASWVSLSRKSSLITPPYEIALRILSLSLFLSFSSIPYFRMCEPPATLSPRCCMRFHTVVYARESIGFMDPVQNTSFKALPKVYYATATLARFFSALARATILRVRICATPELW